VPMLIWLASQLKDAYGLDVEITGARARHGMSDAMRVMLYQATRELLLMIFGLLFLLLAGAGPLSLDARLLAQSFGSSNGRIGS